MSQPDHTVTDCDSVPEPAALESHGCYNQRIMEHCRPEHDYRIDMSAQCVEKTEENRQVDEFEKAFMEDKEIIPAQLKHLADLKKRAAEARATIDEYENPTTGKNPVVQNPTCRNFRQVQNPLPDSMAPSSVIPWMSP